MRAKLLYGGRRERVPACLRGSPDGRGGVRYRLDGGFPRRGCVLGRGARTHLTSFSFRAFRFATRCPGGCRGRCPHRPGRMHRFTGIFGEFAASQRADVGIGPYNQASMCIRIRRGFLRKRAAFSGRTESSAPTGTARVSPPGRRCRGRRNSLQTAAEAAGLRPEQTGSRPQARRCRLPPGRKGPRR